MPDGEAWLDMLKITIRTGFHNYQANNDHRRYSEVVADRKVIPCTACLDHCPFPTIDIDTKTSMQGAGKDWTEAFQAATEEVQRVHRIMSGHRHPDIEHPGRVAKIVEER